MKNFIDQVRGSIYDPFFYRNLSHKETSYTIVYLVKLSLIIGLFTSIFSIISLFTLQKAIIEKAGVHDIGSLATKYVEMYFPSDLIISLKGNSITSNSSQPVEFPVPYDWFGMEDLKSQYFLKDIAVIAPTEEFSPELFTKYDSYIIVSSSSAAIYDPSKESIKTMDLKDVPASMQGKTLDKIQASKLAGDVREYVNRIAVFMYPVLAIGILFGATLYIIISALLFALWIAFICWLIGKFTKSTHGFGDYYLRAIHAETLFIILSWTIGTIIALGAIPLFNTLLTLFVLYFNDNFKKHP